MEYPESGDRILYRGLDNKLYEATVIGIVRAIPENKIKVQTGDRLNVIYLHQIEHNASSI